ncbi:MAG: hypothetical protein ACO3ZW_02445 [Opitutales bacterium]|jgi:hypothetical protein
MNNGTELIQRAASFDWETLAPVIFFVLYGIAQLLGSKKKGKGEDDGEPDVDPAERARQIREQIRRRIQERQREGSPEAEPVTVESAYDPTVPEYEQPRRTLRMPVEHQRPRQSFSREAEVSERKQSLVQQLAEQRRRLDKARKTQKEAQDRARRMVSEAGAQWGKSLPSKVTASSGGALRKQLLSGLRDPGGVRKAVLYREILDPPLGLR